MESSDTARKVSDSGSDSGASSGAQGDGATTTRRKLNDAQEREVTRLYAETETPVSEISKRFGIGESSVYRVAQRHGAKLRGRTATGGATKASAGRTRRAAASGATGARGGRRGGRRAAAAGAAASTGTAAPAGGTGRRGRRPA